MNAPRATAKAEWRKFWYLPMVAALGYSAVGLPTYTLGPAMEHLEREFGWTRAQISAGPALVNLVSAVGAVFVGALVDRLGSRRIGIVGVLLICGSVTLLGAATGAIANWIILWAMVAFSMLTVQGTVWTSAVVSRFEAARGMALALTLSGASVSASIIPLLATWLIETSGWRSAFMGVGAIWAVATFPFTLLFFRGAQDVGREDRARSRAAVDLLPGFTLPEAVRKPAFYKLLVAGGLFAVCIIGSVLHFVPLLIDSGAPPMRAASAASVIGVFSIIGRLGTGALLDRLPGNLVGAASILVPVPGAVLLLIDRSGSAGHFAAAASFGLTLGAEMDLITYLAARHFGLKKFGAIVGSLFCAVAVGSALGPLAAGAIFDRFGSYAPFLAIAIGLMLASSLLLGSLNRPPNWAELPEPEGAGGASEHGRTSRRGAVDSRS